MQSYHLQNRPDREIIPESDILDILKKGKFAVISLCRNNEPYIVTLSYGYDAGNNALYFHCAPQGLKLEFIKSNPNVCATVIEDGGYVAGDCAHNYKSVVFWGEMKVVNDPDEKKHGMFVLLNHLEGDSAYIREKLKKADGYGPKMTILKLDISQIHGKAGK